MMDMNSTNTKKYTLIDGKGKEFEPYPFGFELNNLHYKVGIDRCAFLVPAATKDKGFANIMQTVEGPGLYNWLFVARTIAWRNSLEAEKDSGVKKLDITCKEPCELCEKFKDYQQRLNKN
jgi:hypothetical protein